MKYFLRKQSGFISNSIFNRFQFSDEAHLGGVASGFLYLSKISKNFRVLVGSGLCIFRVFLNLFKTTIHWPFKPVYGHIPCPNPPFWPKFQSPSWIKTLLQESSRIRTLLQSFNRIRTLNFYSYFVHFQSNLLKSFKMSQKLRVLVKTGLCSESPSWIRTLILISIFERIFQNSFHLSKLLHFYQRISKFWGFIPESWSNQDSTPESWSNQDSIQSSFSSLHFHWFSKALLKFHHLLIRKPKFLRVLIESGLFLRVLIRSGLWTKTSISSCF